LDGVIEIADTKTNKNGRANILPQDQLEENGCEGGDVTFYRTWEVGDGYQLKKRKWGDISLV